MNATGQLNQIVGPVLLTGHCYAGVVITNAATSASNVVGLVYVAAFAAPSPPRRFSEASGPPAWRKLPSWTVVALMDALRIERAIIDADSY